MNPVPRTKLNKSIGLAGSHLWDSHSWRRRTHAPAILHSFASAIVIALALLFAVAFASAFAVGSMFISECSYHTCVHDNVSSSLKVLET